jgi:hypothetical protein
VNAGAVHKNATASGIRDRPRRSKVAMNASRSVPALRIVLVSRVNGRTNSSRCHDRYQRDHFFSITSISL